MNTVVRYRELANEERQRANRTMSLIERLRHLNAAERFDKMAKDLG